MLIFKAVGPMVMTGYIKADVTIIGICKLQLFFSKKVIFLLLPVASRKDHYAINVDNFAQTC